MTHALSSNDRVPATATEIVSELCDDVLGVWEHHISTHYAGCWKYHVACFAYRVKTLLEEADDA